MSNALPPFSAKLLSSRPLGGGMRELCLEVPDEFCRASRPGMFVHLKVPDAPQHLLRRPISIMDLEPEDNLLVLGVQPKGEGTRLICSMQEGGCIEMLARQRFFAQRRQNRLGDRRRSRGCPHALRLQGILKIRTGHRFPRFSYPGYDFFRARLS